MNFRKADVVVTTTKSEGTDKKNLKPETVIEHKAMDFADLPNGSDEELASVSPKVLFRVAGSEQYAKGDWDKIHYQVEVSVEVGLLCEQTTASATAAAKLGYEFAIALGREAMVEAVAAHTDNIINNIYPGLFKGE